MATHGLTQVQVVSLARLSSTGKLSLWLGRGHDQLSAATEAEVDARIAAYLDEAPIPPASTSASASPEGVPCPEMGPGWRRESKKRPSPSVGRMGSNGSKQTNWFQTDHIFIAPDGRKFTSRVKAVR